MRGDEDFMSGTSKTEMDSSGFQQFESLNDSKYLLVSKQLIEVLEGKQGEENNASWIVQRYLSIDKFVDSTLHRYFYMAAPKKWDDPFETMYLDSLDSQSSPYNKQEGLSELKNMSIFCVCMTYNNSDNEEASWKAYSDNMERVIRVTYDFKKLCSIIEEVKEKDFYIGKVDYRSREFILAPNNVSDKMEMPLIETTFVNNFCLKQEAYQYEKELRFCIIKKGDHYKKVDYYKIEGIDLTPAITKITLPPINYNGMLIAEEIEKKAKQHINYLLLKTLCPEVPIHVSNLYDKSQVEMTSEIKL